MSEVSPVPTRYRGILYRSRTEARWAVYFDALGVQATYEPESYSIDGAWYLPDFEILAWNLFVEVKGKAPTPYERERALKLCRLTGRPVLLVSGPPSEERGILFQDGAELPGNAIIAECAGCGMIAIHREDAAPYLLTLPSGEGRCAGGFDAGGHRVEGAVMASSNERFGVYPDAAE